MTDSLSDRERGDLFVAQEKNAKALDDARRALPPLADALATAYKNLVGLRVVDGHLYHSKVGRLPSDSEVREAVANLRNLEKERDKIRRALNPEGRA